MAAALSCSRGYILGGWISGILTFGVRPASTITGSDTRRPLLPRRPILCMTG